MFVHRLQPFVTKSRAFNFATGQFIKKMQIGNFDGLFFLQVLAIYRIRGFEVNFVMMDVQFDSMDIVLQHKGVTLNTCSRNEHIHNIERHIRMVKERVRCIYTTLSFKKMPGEIIIEMVYTANFWLNAFYLSGTIVDGSSSCTVMTGLSIDYNTHCS